MELLLGIVDVESDVAVEAGDDESTLLLLLELLVVEGVVA